MINANMSKPNVAHLVVISLFLMALTGFVCTHKIQAEEECLSSNVLCYECDSRIDPNCADPFDFSPTSSLELLKPTVTTKTVGNNETNVENRQASLEVTTTSVNTITTTLQPNESNSTIPQRQPKKLPAVAICHGCCVKITSRTPDGGVYVKRTCTTNLQINYFMVGLVCMKESGDRGKMCFCEIDYCNGAPSTRRPPEFMLIVILIVSFAIVAHRANTPTLLLPQHC